MSGDREDWVMSDAERKEVIDQIAQRVVDGLLRASTDEEHVGKMVDTATAQLQRVVGRAVIRAVVYLVAAGMLIGAWKTGLLEWIATHTSR